MGRILRVIPFTDFVLRCPDAGDRHGFISALRDLAGATGDPGGNLAVACRDIETLKINGYGLPVFSLFG
ncbi:MAG: hypothetical protein WC379_10380 [Methanoregula sp.]|jgi:hypothetical protein